MDAAAQTKPSSGGGLKTGLNDLRINTQKGISKEREIGTSGTPWGLVCAMTRRKNTLGKTPEIQSASKPSKWGVSCPLQPTPTTILEPRVRGQGAKRVDGGKEKFSIPPIICGTRESHKKSEEGTTMEYLPNLQGVGLHTGLLTEKNKSRRERTYLLSRMGVTLVGTSLLTKRVNLEGMAWRFQRGVVQEATKK